MNPTSTETSDSFTITKRLVLYFFLFTFFGFVLGVWTYKLITTPITETNISKIDVIMTPTPVSVSDQPSPTNYVPSNGIKVDSTTGFSDENFYKGVNASKVEKEGDKYIFSDPYYGYQMDFSSFPDAFDSSSYPNYPVQAYELDLYKRYGDLLKSLARLSISSPIENPANLTLDEFAKKMFSYKEGEYTLPNTGCGGTFYAIQPVSLGDKQGITWYSKNGCGGLYSQEYLVPIDDHIIYFKLIAWKEDDFNNSLKLFNESIKTFVVTKKIPEVSDDKFFNNHSLTPSTTLKLLPSYGKNGDKISLEGVEWPSNLKLKIYMYHMESSVSEDNIVAQIETDKNGKFKTQVTVPNNLNPKILGSFIKVNVINSSFMSGPSLYKQRGEAIFYLFSEE